jgi:hypothetical protein
MLNKMLSFDLYITLRRDRRSEVNSMIIIVFTEKEYNIKGMECYDCTVFWREFNPTISEVDASLIAENFNGDWLNMEFDDAVAALGELFTELDFHKLPRWDTIKNSVSLVAKIDQRLSSIDDNFSLWKYLNDILGDEKPL